MKHDKELNMKQSDDELFDFSHIVFGCEPSDHALCDCSSLENFEDPNDKIYLAKDDNPTPYGEKFPNEKIKFGHLVCMVGGILSSSMQDFETLWQISTPAEKLKEHCFYVDGIPYNPFTETTRPIDTFSCTLVDYIDQFASAEFKKELLDKNITRVRVGSP